MPEVRANLGDFCEPDGQVRTPRATRFQPLTKPEDLSTNMRGAQGCVHINGIIGIVYGR